MMDILCSLCKKEEKSISNHNEAKALTTELFCWFEIRDYCALGVFCLAICKLALAPSVDMHLFCFHSPRLHSNSSPLCKIKRTLFFIQSAQLSL